MKTLLVALSAILVSTGSAQQPSTWKLTEEWRVGGEPDGPRSFIDVSGLGVLRDGRIVVLDFKDQQLHFLDASGKPVRTVGRKGAGPGEFQTANGLVVSPKGEVIVNDASNSRLTIFSSTGDLVRTVPTQSWGFGYLWDARFDPDGRLNEYVSYRLPGDTANSSGRRVWAIDYSKNDTVPQLSCPSKAPADPEAYSFRYRTARGGGTMSIPNLMPRVTTITAPNGTWWAGVWPDFATIERRAPKACTTVSTITLAGARVPVPKAVRDSAIENATTFFGRGGAPLPDMSRIPNVYPAYDAMFVDASNRLWVERPTSAALRRLEVFSPTGTPVATLTMPVRIAAYRPVVVTNDRFLAFVSDEDGLQYLVAMKIGAPVVPER